MICGWVLIEGAGYPGCYDSRVLPALPVTPALPALQVPAALLVLAALLVPVLAALLVLLTLFAQFDRKVLHGLSPEGVLVAPHSKARIKSFPAARSDSSHFTSQAPMTGQS